MRSAVESKIILEWLAVHVRRRRKALGVSQVQLAQSAHVHANMIGRMERGVYNPTVSVLCAGLPGCRRIGHDDS